MDFKESLKELKKGKKVRRASWDTGLFISQNQDFLYWNDGGADKRVVLAISNLEGTDYEIYEKEDNWNLADKKENTKKGICYKSDYVYVEDIKTFIQKTKEDDKEAKTIVEENSVFSSNYKKGYVDGMNDADYHKTKRVGKL